MLDHHASSGNFVSLITIHVQDMVPLWVGAVASIEVGVVPAGVAVEKLHVCLECVEMGNILIVLVSGVPSATVAAAASVGHAVPGRIVDVWPLAGSLGRGEGVVIRVAFLSPNSVVDIVAIM